MTKKLSAALISALTLAAPAAAQAAVHSHAHHRSRSHAITGTVLSRTGRSFELVGHSGAVRPYHVAGSLARSVRRGARVAFTATGATASHLRVTGHARQVSFLARVGGSAGGAVSLTLGDGRHVKVKRVARKSARVRKHVRIGHVVAHMASDLPVISIQGLQPGQTVLVTITLDPSGNQLQISIKLVDSSTGGTGTSGPATTGGQHATGTVVGVDEDNGVITVADANGNTTDYALSDALLASSDSLPGECDIVDVAYHADPTDPSTLIADMVDTTGTDTTTGDCATTDEPADQEAIGQITALDPVNGAVTVQTADGQTLPLSADASLLDGLTLGGQVDVLYYQADDGSLVADDIETVDSATGAGDTGSGDTGSGDTGSGDTGSGDTSSADGSTSAG
jgi:hypothetical protein